MGILQNENAIPVASAGGFYSHQISRSCRFDAADTSHLVRTLGTPTNTDKFSMSVWVKRGAAKSGALNYFSGFSSGSDYGVIGFTTYGSSGSDGFEFWDYPSSQINLVTTAQFRDFSGWSQFVILGDSGQSTSSDRVKIYVNGTLQTAFDNNTYPSSGFNFGLNTSGNKIYAGSAGSTANASYLHLDGYLADFVFIDGTTYAISDFGETKNGVWIPKDPSGLTFGNNGFYLKFENASDLGNDSSGNNNDLTASGLGADHQVLDSPTFGS